MLARKLYSWSYRVREETGKSHGVTELEKRQESLMELKEWPSTDLSGGPGCESDNNPRREEIELKKIISEFRWRAGCENDLVAEVTGKPKRRKR